MEPAAHPRGPSIKMEIFYNSVLCAAKCAYMHKNMCAFERIGKVARALAFLSRIFRRRMSCNRRPLHENQAVFCVFVTKRDLCFVF